MKTNLLLLSFAFLISCSQNVNIPKPHVYPKLDFPEKEYQPITKGADNDLPYYFEKPVYAELKIFKRLRKSDDAKVKYWKDLFFPAFNATLHLSYANFNNLQKLDTLKEDTRKLAFEHAFKADDIQTIALYKKEEKVYGQLYLIEGNTATNLNFYLTDSTQNFLRGALYFNEKTKPDSILPVFQFVKDDIEQMINTFRWR